MPPDVRRWLCPAGKGSLLFQGLCPPTDQGHSPQDKKGWSGGAEPRLTSGGAAEAGVDADI